MSVVVAFRTHIWDDDIKKIALRIRSTFTQANFVILTDETLGPLNTGNIPKITHTADFTSYGLPANATSKGLWFNGDYPLYALRKHFPATNHFIMIENDVQINFDLDVIIKFITQNNVDLIAHEIVPSDSSWLHHYSMDYFKKTMKCLFPFIAISKRAIDHLLQTRINMSKTKAHWAYCEGFIASAIHLLPEANIHELKSFCKPNHYGPDNCHHYDDPRVNVSGTISHPVRGNNFPEKCLSEHNISTIFSPNSVLRVGLKNIPPKLFYNQIYSKIIRTGNISLLKQFNDLSLQQGWIMKPEAINWALGADAEQSSISEHAQVKDIKQDAKRATSGIIDPEYFFHTELEESPWWKVKLHEKIRVRHIIIYNRLSFAERASKIKIEISEDNQNWTTVAEYPDGILFGGADGNPLVIKVNSIWAQYIRVSLLEKGILHLNQVEVYDQ